MSEVNSQTAVPLWNCTFSKNSELTVGEKFTLRCQGLPVPAFTSVPKLKFSVEEAEYSLQVLEIKQMSEREAEFIMTAYKPGQFRLDWVDFSDGKTTIHVTNLEWQVASVVQNQPGEQPQPYGPIGPFVMAWPLWLWGALGLFFAVLVGFLAWRMRLRQQRQRWLDDLAKNSYVLNPHAYFHKELRGFLRRYGRSKADGESLKDYAAALDDNFRLYLARELKLPAQQWPEHLIYRDLKRRHRKLFKATQEELAPLLYELKRARQAKTLSLKDCEQLHEMARQLVDKIYLIREAKT